MKPVQKCVRLSEEAARYIEAYPGDNFSSKLESLVLDRVRLLSELDELDSQLNCKRVELRGLSDKIRGYRTIDLRLTSLIAALVNVLGDSEGQI